MEIKKFLMNISVPMFLAVFVLITASCGTASSVKQPIEALSLNGCFYVIESCEIKDNRATEMTCNALRDQVHYGLLKQGLYEKDGHEATRIINLTITYFRNVSTWGRAFGGILAGKDGLDVTVDVIEKQTGTVVGSSNISTYNITAANSTEKSMIESVSKKIVQFLTSGPS